MLIDKIKTALSKLLQVIPDNIANANIRTYYGAWLGIFLLFIMFVFGWIFNLYATGRADLPVIVQFFGVFSMAVTFYTVLGRKIIDKDKDGISDDDEVIK